MIQVHATDRWKAAYPGGCAGIMELSGVGNGPDGSALDSTKRALEGELRQKYAGFSRGDFLALEAMQAYEKYYKKFDKTYHVQLQLESMVLKGKNFPNTHPLVDAYFMAELQTLVLTAGHNADRLDGGIRIDITQEGDEIIQMNGAQKKVRPGDMMMADNQGIISTIIYGQDQRTPVKDPTDRVVYASYGPPGIQESVIRRQMELTHEYVKLYAPSAKLEQLLLIS